MTILFRPMLFLLCVLLLSAEVYGDEFFESWAASGGVTGGGEYRSLLTLRNPDLTVRVRTEGTTELEAAMMYHPENLTVSAGYLRMGGILDLLYNPLSADDLRARGKASFLRLPSHTIRSFPALSVALLPVELYAALFSDGSLHSLGAVVNIGEPHRFLRIVSNLGVWDWGGEESLTSLFWLPGKREVLNVAAIVDIPALAFSNGAVDRLSLSEFFVIASGFQLGLAVRGLDGEPYLLSPASWWIHGQYGLRGSLLLPAAAPVAILPLEEEPLLQWELNMQLAYLSGAYLRTNATKSSFQDAGGIFSLGGWLNVLGLLSLHLSFLDRGDENTVISLELRSENSPLDLRAKMDYRSPDFYGLFSGALRGQFRPAVELKLLWGELNPQFVAGKIGFFMDVDVFTLGTEIWVRDDRNDTRPADFFPSTFDTLVGLNLYVGFGLDVADYRLKIECTASSPERLFLDKLLYGQEEPAFFLAGWKLKFNFSLGSGE